MILQGILALFAMQSSIDPEPKSVRFTSDSIVITSSFQLRPAFLERRFPGLLANMREHALQEIRPETPIVRIRLVGTSASPIIPEWRRHAGGYRLIIASDSVLIEAADSGGAVSGLTVLEQLLKEGSGVVTTGEIQDWPDLPLRAFHFVLRGVTLSVAMDLVVEARRARFNIVIVQLADAVRLASLPGVARADAWSAEDLAVFSEFARGQGVEVIPELKLATHQEKFLKDRWPRLMFNRHTYDPRRPEVYDIVYAVLEEVIVLLHPAAIHIGHDEVAGIYGRSAQRLLGAGERPLPPDLFVRDVQKIFQFLSSRGVATWMWGDAFLHREAYPKADVRNILGTREYADYLIRIPDEVVICDWHYWDRGPDFPTVERFRRNGHRVIGATWYETEPIEAFSRYMAGSGSGGMIATTWFHLQRGDIRLVRSILANSSRAFWNATTYFREPAR